MGRPKGAPNRTLKPYRAYCRFGDSPQDFQLTVWHVSAEAAYNRLVSAGYPIASYRNPRLVRPGTPIPEPPVRAAIYCQPAPRFTL